VLDARETSRASRTVRTDPSGVSSVGASDMSEPDLLLRLTGRLVKGCRSRAPYQRSAGSAVEVSGAGQAEQPVAGQSCGDARQQVRPERLLEHGAQRVVE